MPEALHSDPEYSGSDSSCNDGDSIAQQHMHIVELIQTKTLTCNALLDAVFVNHALVQKLSKGDDESIAKNRKRGRKSVPLDPLAQFMNRLLTEFYAERDFSFDFLTPNQRMQLLEPFDALCECSTLFKGLSMYVAHCILTENMLRIIRYPEIFYKRVPRSMRADGDGLSSHSKAILSSCLRLDGHLDFLGVPRETSIESGLSAIGNVDSLELNVERAACESCSLLDGM